MTNIEKLNNIGIEIGEIDKFLKNNNVEIDINSLSDIEFFNILQKYLENKRESIIKLVDKLSNDKKTFQEEKVNWEKSIQQEQQKKWLDFNKKIEEEEKRIIQQKEDAKLKLKIQKDEFNQKLQKEELEFQAKLSKDKDDFLRQVKEDFENYINLKQKELSQKEQFLRDEEIELNNKMNLLNEKEKTFETLKEKELYSLENQLKEKQIQFEYSLKEKELKKHEEIDIQIKQLYKNKEDELFQKEQELNKLNIELQALKQDLSIKEQELIKEKDNISNKVNELIKSKIVSYEKIIELLEDETERLREEKDEYFQELNDYKDNQDKELISELNEKKEELKKLKNKIENIKEEKNSQIEKNEQLIKELQDENLNTKKENETFRTQIENIERLNSEIRIKDEQLKEIDLLKGENEYLRRKSEAIYSTGKEEELRIKDIENRPYKKQRLEQKLDIKDEIEYLTNIEKYMKEYGVEYPKRLLYAFHTALKSADFSPLTVLSGVSGTGKSELPKLYSHFGGFNFLAEAVQPTWDSPESMIGFYNMMENKFDATNILKFLLQTSKSHINDSYAYGWKDSMNMILLDEMNLAHIELYFAEFLSKFEQKRGSDGVKLNIKLGTEMNYQIPLDTNLLWIGTMNEDETTKSLSDKVLDRAFSINFPRPEKLLSRGKLKSLEDIKPFEYLHRDIWNQWIQKESLFIGEKSDVLREFKEISNQINEHLASTGRAIGHRVWQSMEYYISNHPLVISNIDNEDEFKKNVKLAFEEQLVQKIMPKLKGIELYGKANDSLSSINNILSQHDFEIVKDFELSMKNDDNQFKWNSANYLKEY